MYCLCSYRYVYWLMDWITIHWIRLVYTWAFSSPFLVGTPERLHHVGGGFIQLRLLVTQLYSCLWLAPSLGALAVESSRTLCLDLIGGPQSCRLHVHNGSLLTVVTHLNENALSTGPD